MLAAMVRACYVTCLTLVLAACAPEQLAGTDLGTDPAPDLTLTDGLTGAPLTLSSLRGNVVVVTFMYANCPDTCPLVAERFRLAQAELGADSDRVHFVAVSVDPLGDTPAAVQRFSSDHRLSRNWHYLIGTRPQLEQVWRAYFVGVTPAPSGPLVGHTDAIFLIDARGRARTLLRTAALGDALTKDLRILLREG